MLASGNRGKLHELQALLAPLNMELLAQYDLGVEEAEEVHSTFLENALLKARHASQWTGLPALADDSGLCTVALNGAPGVRSARFSEDFSAHQESPIVSVDRSKAAVDGRNNLELVRRLAGQTRAAWYACVLVWFEAPRIHTRLWWMRFGPARLSMSRAGPMALVTIRIFFCLNWDSRLPNSSLLARTS